MVVDISYPLIIFCMITNLQTSTAPKCPPVINSSRLRNHKTGLNCWSIRANCLPTSKAEPEKRGGKCPAAEAVRAEPAPEGLSCGLDEPGKVMASELLFAIKLMAVAPCC